MLEQLLMNIWTVVLDTAFWLLIGLLAAGWIKVFIPQDAMRRWVGGKGIGAILRAALLGAPLPLCSCGVLPAAIGLHRAGASKEATVSFLISTPETSIDSVTVTYALMGPVMAIYRPIAALTSAVVTGMMTALIKESAIPAVSSESAVASCCGSSEPDEEAAAETASCCSAEPVTTSCCASEETECTQEAAPRLHTRWFMAIRYAGAELLDDIAVWLALGIVLAGVMLTFIPPDWLAQWGSGLPAMLLMLLVGIPMYICAVASTPIAAGLLLAGVSPGVVLIFLLVGPATNITSFALVKRELGNAVTAVYFFGVAATSLVMGILLEWLLKTNQWQVTAELGHAHDFLPHWLSVGSAIVLLLLAIKPLRRRLLPVLG